MRPAGGYYNAAGVRLPSVTTIGGRFGDKSQLMYWAAQAVVRSGPKDSFMEESAKAADVGTLAHQMVEARIKGLKTIQAKDTSVKT